MRAIRAVGRRAQATLSVPARVDPGLAGIVLHHAYVVVGTSTIDLISNAVPLRLVQ